MAPSNSFVVLIFLFNLLPLQILADQSRCPKSFDCQHLRSLEFPLSNNQSDCGLFVVNCTTAPPLIQLEAGGKWYEILDKISINKFSIRDTQLETYLVQNQCFSFVNLSLPQTPLTSFSFSPNLTMFLCMKGPHDEELHKNFQSQDCLDYTVYYKDPANTSTVNLSDLPVGCWELQMPRNSSQNDPRSLYNLLSADFNLEWNISADCMRCHHAGGQCGTNSMNGFLCRTPGIRNSISTRTIIGLIVVGALLSIVLPVVFLWWKGCCSRRNDTLEYELRGVKFQTSSFTYQQIKTATQNFNPANKIGEGGFGPVYKGTLSDGTVVAVKQLSSKSRQGNREFVTEIGMISALQHPNLVKLYGCCVHGNNLLLIYEYMENNSLARALFGSEDHKLNLDWPTRHKICVGVARGLAFLHEESALKIVHRDIKASNVLLDGKLIPKISDFGLARLHEEDDTHISTHVAGTLGYMAPEYAMNGYLTDKADVYSFGVVLLEVVSGRANIIMPGEEFNLLGWAKFLSQNDNLIELVDPRLESTDKEEIMATINIALICTDFVGAERPSMSTVVSMLTGSSGQVSLLHT